MNLAIIGAGAAGLAAARALRQSRPGLRVTVYEKSRGLGGRAATRRREGYTFDHGAQYFKTPTPALEQLVLQELPADGLLDIGLPVWTFDGAGTIGEGDPQQNNRPKWTYADGLSRLGKLLAEGLEVRREVRVAALRRTEPGQAGAGRWALVDPAGAPVGEADLVLLTPPAPQTAELLARSELDEPARAALLDELGRASYRRCISFALALDRLIARPFCALVNSDRRHPVAWLALEHTKGPQRCPPGHSLLLPQMGPAWSEEHWDEPDELLAPLAAELAGTLLGEELETPLWCDVQRWRYALPNSCADFDALNRHGAPHGLFFAGDYAAGKGRIHRAIQSGWDVAELIRHT